MTTSHFILNLRHLSRERSKYELDVRAASLDTSVESGMEMQACE